MCRLLYIRSEEPFEPTSDLERFAEIAKNSQEYQGHGWGVAWLRQGKWEVYKNIQPIWEDDVRRFKETTALVAHARSAFEDTEIVIENNMPFFDEEYVFVFNGELRGVKIKEEGRIGAEKIFNFIKRFQADDMQQALERGYKVIEKRTNYVRAMNIIIADTDSAYVGSLFSADPDYFTLRSKQTNGKLIICSQPYPGESGWANIPNRSVSTF